MLDTGQGTLDKRTAGQGTKDTGQKEIIVTVTERSRSERNKLSKRPSPDSYRDAFYQLYHFRTTPQLRCDYLYLFRTAPQLRCAPFGDQIFASHIGVKKKLSFAQLLFYSFIF